MAGTALVPLDWSTARFFLAGSPRGVRRRNRRIAALTLAGDGLVRLVYVPTECNPALAPSSGYPGRTAVCKRTLKEQRKVPRMKNQPFTARDRRQAVGLDVCDRLAVGFVVDPLEAMKYLSVCEQVGSNNPRPPITRGKIICEKRRPRRFFALVLGIHNAYN